MIGGRVKNGLSWAVVPFLLIGIGVVGYLFWLDWNSAAGRDGLLINNSTLWGRDFVNVWSGGRMLLDGDLAALYDINAYQAWQAANLDPGIKHHNYSYPPTSLLYAWTFASLPYVTALFTWLGLSAVAFVAAARPWLKDAGIAAPWVLLLPTTALCLWAGHYGLFFGALWLWAWREVDTSPRTAGIATALMIIKPHLAILMPLLFVLKGAWRAFAWAALALGALVGLSIALFGAGLWETYLTSTSGTQLGLVDNIDAFFARMMTGTVTNMLAAGASPALAWGAQIAVALVALILVINLPRNRASLCFGGAIATFLILPYGFNYDLTVVGLAALLLAHNAWRSGERPRFLIAGLALALPPAMIFLGREAIYPAPLILLALLFMAASRKPMAFAPNIG
ncbi:glycosyltransferase family 87 protein [Sphingomicrobium marinum]|uniref:glycosyltransferase family 87 protein n=1 Tax=Sphingomicrobium marinum TaxID=1227950 RepID=UPI00223FC4FA|nr:glycosyltransferase family 87 protein [Sphingomicrobium marinum]